MKLEHGLQVIKIFKDHSSKQCILDDFEFYEERQKRIQEKKAKQQQFQKQVGVFLCTFLVCLMVNGVCACNNFMSWIFRHGKRNRP